MLAELPSFQRLWGRIYSLPFQRMLSVVSFQQWHHSDLGFHHHLSFSDSPLFVTKLMDVLLDTEAPASQLFFTEAASVTFLLNVSKDISGIHKHLSFAFVSPIEMVIDYIYSFHQLIIEFGGISTFEWKELTHSFYSCILVHNVDRP